jgi:hypothetical protein
VTITKDGISPNREGREGRGILSLHRNRRPSETAQPGGIEQVSDSNNSDPAQRFEAALWADRNRWDIARRSLPADAESWLRGGGFTGHGKLSKPMADKLLTSALAALGGAQ